jgi:hypothetical protein
MKRRSDTTRPAGRGHAGEIRDLVTLGHFLGPEVHRVGGIDQAALALTEWVDDVAVLEEAETIALDQHHDESAEILHRAKVLAAVAH